MEKLYSIEVICKCREDQALALNEAIMEAAVLIGVEIVIILPAVPDDDQD